VRVLVLSWEYPPRLHGGLGRHVHGLARALAAAGHDVHVVALGHPDASPRAVVDGVTVHRAAPPPAAVPDGEWVAQVLEANLGLLATAVAVTDEVDFDVVHAHDWLVGHALAGLGAVRDLPAVATVHATERGRHQGWLPGPMNRWIDAMERDLVARAARVIVCSRAMAAAVAEHLDADPGRLAVVGGGVDVRAFATGTGAAAVRAELAPGGTRLIVCAGRLEYEKGMHVLLAALRRLRARGRDVRLALVGEGTYRSGLEARVDELRLRRSVTFTGFADRVALPRLLHAADVVAVPSLYEPFGLIALEAMAAGTPVVASAVGGLTEHVTDGRTGLLVPPDDPAALAAALARVLDDDPLAATITAGGRACAAERSWATAAAQTAAVYAAALTSSGG
jgi:glycogen synthase